jgi:transcriptional regulator CtsR
MEKKNIKELSNSQLNIYKKELTNEFEVIKSKIDSLIKTLKDTENEYLKVETELKIRSNNIY